MAKYKKSEYQKFKERHKIPWSVKTLTNFWIKLHSFKIKPPDPMEEIQLRWSE